nr:2-dehydropantoate 2-reductase N-terminal domain-containing protein [Paludibacterium denitrificans]
MKLAILGAGAWGSALAITFAKHHTVTLWARDAEQVAELARERVNRRYLPDCPFPDGLGLTADLSTALDGAELILVVTPIAGLRPTLRALTALERPLPPLLWACKGFETGSSLLPHQVVAEELLNGSAVRGVIRPELRPRSGIRFTGCRDHRIR